MIAKAERRLGHLTWTSCGAISTANWADCLGGLHNHPGEEALVVDFSRI